MFMVILIVDEWVWHGNCREENYSSTQQKIGKIEARAQGFVSREIFGSNQSKFGLSKSNQLLVVIFWFFFIDLMYIS